MEYWRRGRGQIHPTTTFPQVTMTNPETRARRGLALSLWFAEILVVWVAERPRRRPGRGVQDPYRLGIQQGNFNDLRKRDA